MRSLGLWSCLGLAIGAVGLILVGLTMALASVVEPRHPVFGPGAILLLRGAIVWGAVWSAGWATGKEWGGFRRACGWSAVALIIEAGVCLVLSEVWV